jgi:tRNA dimethylallyltransferase
MTATDRRPPVRPAVLALVGPTATGKTEASLVLAERLGAEIVSVDSMLVYRGMDVGTAKPTPEQRARIPHHLIDVAEPSEPSSVARYQELARDALADLARRRGTALLVGGSALYLRAAVDDLEFPATDPDVRASLERDAELAGAAGMHERLLAADPVAAAKIEPGNVRRSVRALEVMEVSGRTFSSYASAWDRFDADRVLAAGVTMDRATLRARIDARVRAMVRDGLLEEVASLVEGGFGGWITSSQAIGYAEVARHLAGEMTLEAAVAATAKRTNALARRQLAFLRRDPRITWFGVGERGAIERVDELEAHLRDRDEERAEETA